MMCRCGWRTLVPGLVGLAVGLALGAVAVPAGACYCGVVIDRVTLEFADAEGSAVDDPYWPQRIVVESDADNHAVLMVGDDHYGLWVEETW